MKSPPETTPISPTHPTICPYGALPGVDDGEANAATRLQKELGADKPFFGLPRGQYYHTLTAKAALEIRNEVHTPPSLDRHPLTTLTLHGPPRSTRAIRSRSRKESSP